MFKRRTAEKRTKVNTKARMNIKRTDCVGVSVCARARAMGAGDAGEGEGDENPKCDSHRPKIIMRITNAFIIGKTEAVTAVIIFLSAVTLPNSRITRNALMNLTSQSGMLEMIASMREMETITKSNQFHPL